MRAISRLLLLPFVLAACSIDPVGPLNLTWDPDGGGTGTPRPVASLNLQSTVVFNDGGYLAASWLARGERRAGDHDRLR